MNWSTFLGVLSALLAIALPQLANSREIAGTNQRLLDGNDAAVAQFPYAATLQSSPDNLHVCGCVVVSARFLLTAAHCTVSGNGKEPLPAKYFRVRVGSIQQVVGGQLHEVRRIVVHERYTFYWNDIALLELISPLTWTERIQPITLASEELPDAAVVTVAGWGRRAADGVISQRLQWRNFNVLSTAACDYGEESILCLAHDAGSGICHGDAGSPAVYKNQLVGLAAYIMDTCGSHYPDDYTKISAHRSWILAQIQD